ncbi:protein G12 [Halyomorpha halys]|uniref:protein G12 n=1 Tax=Halyomorpha halys TaxID=286706 RepID=UPI0006D4D26B|nr:uncharacterized protein LOC106682869 [Halyomorpha halys]XP_014279452.1 uncharacterized protein LOC106682869 [Halyomorpha halys]
MCKYFIYIFGAILVNGVPIPRDNRNLVEQDVIELVEMVPFEKVMAIAIEYAIQDQQVKSLLGYLSGSKFKENVAAIEASPQFSDLAYMAEMYNIDAYSLANKVNHVLDIPFVQPDQEKNSRWPRSPGDGVVALVKDAMENVPLAEIKEAYKYKIDSNPQFKSLMERVLSGEARLYLEPLLESTPFLETKRDLEELGLPLNEIHEFLERISTNFFDMTIISTAPPMM